MTDPMTAESDAGRVRVSAARLRELWFSDGATGMIHDHSTQEVVVTMADGVEYACTFEEKAALHD
ncbi:MAG TPA: hypothetical protein VFK41_06525 [Nocardioidaceae bacterium]|nr:hypothetical protein [Nocardioidaceae bacterium]